MRAQGQSCPRTKRSHRHALANTDIRPTLYPFQNPVDNRQFHTAKQARLHIHQTTSPKNLNTNTAQHRTAPHCLTPPTFFLARNNPERTAGLGRPRRRLRRRPRLGNLVPAARRSPSRSPRLNHHPAARRIAPLDVLLRPSSPVHSRRHRVDGVGDNLGIAGEVAHRFDDLVGYKKLISSSALSPEERGRAYEKRQS